jgi:hypothetical protein
MSKSNYLENAVLDFWLNANAGGFSAPATIYLGLIETADPTIAQSMKLHLPATQQLVLVLTNAHQLLLLQLLAVALPVLMPTLNLRTL